jgi:hypothetical protein
MKRPEPVSESKRNILFASHLNEDCLRKIAVINKEFEDETAQLFTARHCASVIVDNYTDFSNSDTPDMAKLKQDCLRVVT